ncbi:hypothetical protein RRG08_018803 [Elysia crispata]|uniref:Uncharacterized protein n=1 Tax=Elysia crispata TaxID=231223 RepID=A0AAE1DLG3_9GAST|nr:hypothetical protein RRG08_018803 [Elysia crispata]
MAYFSARLYFILAFSGVSNIIGNAELRAFSQWVRDQSSPPTCRKGKQIYFFLETRTLLIDKLVRSSIQLRFWQNGGYALEMCNSVSYYNKQQVLLESMKLATCVSKAYTRMKVIQTEQPIRCVIIVIKAQKKSEADDATTCSKGLGFHVYSETGHSQNPSLIVRQLSGLRLVPMGCHVTGRTGLFGPHGFGFHPPGLKKIIQI